MAEGMVACGPDGKPIASERYNADSFAVATGTTDLNVREDTTNTIFNNYAQNEYAHRVAIIATGEIGLKFNSSNNDTITISQQRVFDDDGLIVRNIFLTNSSGASVTVDIYIR